MNNPTRVEIAPRSIVSVILIIIAFILAWKLRFILISLLVAYILMTGFSVLADFLHTQGLSRRLSAIFAYLISITVLVVGIFFVLPPLLVQIRDLVNNLPVYINKLNYIYTTNHIPGIDSHQLTNLVTSRLDQIISNVWGFLFNTVEVVISFVTIAVLSFYMLLERDTIKKNLFWVFPHLPKDRVESLAAKIEKQLGNWLKSQVLLMVMIGVSIFVGLSLLNVPYALPLAIVAGVLEAVPVIGPILSAGLAILFIITVNPIGALGVALLYIIVQQVESHIVVPNLMGNVIGLNPLLTIIAILIGANIFGLVGVLISVPVAAIIQVIISDYTSHQPKTA